MDNNFLCYCERIIKAQDDKCLVKDYLLTEYIYNSDIFDLYVSEWVLYDEFLQIREMLHEEIAKRFCTLFDNEIKTKGIF